MTPEMGLFALLGAAWVGYLLRPFYSGEVGAGGVDERRRLAEAKRGYLFALRDAEVDFESGKLSEDDYRAIRSRLEEKAAEAMRLLDELGGGSPEARIERALKEMRARGKGGDACAS